MVRAQERPALLPRPLSRLVSEMDETQGPLNQPSTKAVCLYYENVLCENVLDFYEEKRVWDVADLAMQHPDTIYFFAELTTEGI